MFLLKRNVDWSLFVAGFSIPLEFQYIIQQLIPVAKGETRNIKIMIDGDSYDAVINNVNFDTNKYQNHPDVLQVRYSEKSPIAKKIQSIFDSSFSYLKYEKSLPENKRKVLKLPDGINEYITLYSTNIADTFVIEYYTSEYNKLIIDEVNSLDEYTLELRDFTQRYDSNTGYIERNCLQRFRKLNRSIGESLKLLYGNRCQITGEYIGDKYGCSVVEAHHIEFFTKSFNNDTSNIIIINPNFHRIIHQTSPIFDRKSLSFIFENGIVEKVKINKHL